jgi:hypothetical protein
MPDAFDLDPPPLSDSDRVFPHLGDEPPAPKRRRFDMLPHAITAAGISIIILVILITHPTFGHKDGRFEIQWGQVPECLPFAESACNQADPAVSRAYSDPNACNKPERVICIVPVGAVSLETIQRTVDRLTAQVSAPIAVAPPLSLNQELLNPSRAQYDGEMLAKRVASTYADRFQDQGALVIALTTVDIYLSSKQTWRYAFGVLEPYRDGIDAAIISTARMAYFDYYAPLKLPLGGNLDVLVWPGQSKIDSRAYKMLLKYVGLGYFGLPLTSDPTSVLYNNILKPDDLDRMHDELPIVLHP